MSFTALSFPDIEAYEAAKQDLAQDNDMKLWRAVWSGRGVPPILALIETQDLDRPIQIAETYGGQYLRSGSERKFVEAALTGPDGPVFDVDDEPPPDEVRQLREDNVRLNQENEELADANQALRAELESKPDDMVRVHLGPPGSPKAIDRVTVGGQLLHGVVEANICQRIRDAATLEVEIARFEVEPYDFATQPFQVALLSDEGLARAAERVALDIEAASEGALHQLLSIRAEDGGFRAYCSCRWASLPYPDRGTAAERHGYHARNCREAREARGR